MRSDAIRLVMRFPGLGAGWMLWFFVWRYGRGEGRPSRTLIDRRLRINDPPLHRPAPVYRPDALEDGFCLGAGRRATLAATGVREAEQRLGLEQRVAGRAGDLGCLLERTDRVRRPAGRERDQPGGAQRLARSRAVAHELKARARAARGGIGEPGVAEAGEEQGTLGLDAAEQAIVARRGGVVARRLEVLVRVLRPVGLAVRDAQVLVSLAEAQPLAHALIRDQRALVARERLIASRLQRVDDAEVVARVRDVLGVLGLGGVAVQLEPDRLGLGDRAALEAQHAFEVEPTQREPGGAAPQHVVGDRNHELERFGGATELSPARGEQEVELRLRRTTRLVRLLQQRSGRDVITRVVALARFPEQPVHAHG